MYFKILADDLMHFDYVYHEGLNEDPKPFDEGTKKKGGLFFTDEKHILEFCDLGNKISEVIIPEKEKVVQVEDVYKAHRIILKEIKELWDLETFKWMAASGVDLHAGSEYAFRMAIENGYIEVVKYLMNAGTDIHALNDDAFHIAMSCKNTEIINLLMNFKEH